VTGTQERHRTDATLAQDQMEGQGTELLMLAAAMAEGAKQQAKEIIRYLGMVGINRGVEGP